MKKKIFLTIEIDKHTALALKFIEQTRGVQAEDLARNMVESCAEQSISQGPGGVVESYVEGAHLYATGEAVCEWTHGSRSLETLKECKATLARIKKLNQACAIINQASKKLGLTREEVVRRAVIANADRILKGGAR